MFSNVNRRPEDITPWQDNGFHAGAVADILTGPIETLEPTIIGLCRCGNITETILRHARNGRIDHVDPECVRTDACGVVKVYAIEGV